MACALALGVLDSDLAEVYEVTTGALNQAVDRNERRFPPEFAFRLTLEEWENLKSQSVISSWGGRRKLPRAFTEHGAVMLASILNSDRAIAASIQVIQVFVRLRRTLEANRSLARRIDELAAKVGEHDRAFAVVFHELRQLAAGELPEEDDRPKRRIGFRRPGEE